MLDRISMSMRIAAGLVVAAATALPGAAAHSQTTAGDYPTVAIADYVLGCMAANGETREALERCSCSIEVISTLLPYDRYEEAEAFLSLGQITGERGALFRGSEQSKAAVGDLRRAQMEAELRCF
jgi:hypothetical protein